MAFTRSLAVDVGIHGIRVNGLAPDVTRSEQLPYDRWLTDEDRAKVPGWVPLGRLGEPADTAGRRRVPRLGPRGVRHRHHDPGRRWHARRRRVVPHGPGGSWLDQPAVRRAEQRPAAAGPSTNRDSGIRCCDDASVNRRLWSVALAIVVPLTVAAVLPACSDGGSGGEQSVVEGATATASTGTTSAPPTSAPATSAPSTSGGRAPTTAAPSTAPRRPGVPTNQLRMKPVRLITGAISPKSVVASGRASCSPRT